MTKRIPLFLALASLASASQAQTVALFAVNQPPQFQVDAGDDLTYEPGLTLQASATGGTSTYTYLWSPPEFLDDPASPTPMVQGLFGPTLFTLQVTDMGTGCALTDEVLVDAIAGISGAGDGALAVFPNPSDGWVRIVAPVSVQRVVLRTPNGALALDRRSMPTRVLALDLSSLSSGLYFMTIELVDGRSNTRILCATSAH